MSNIKLFESKQIRTVWKEVNEKWYFVAKGLLLIIQSIDARFNILKIHHTD